MVRPAGFADAGGATVQAASTAWQPTTERLPPPQSEATPGTRMKTEDVAGGLRVVPIPPSAWEAIPPACLARMFEFERVRQEWERTYGTAPSDLAADGAPRLTLEDIVELALINSREYQAQKETLYRAALDLTLERFDYQVKFLVGGNGADVDHDHRRTGGITTDSLGIGTGLQADKMLTTGGTLLGRFANDVVLTFNGPQGFAADVSSELLLSITQTVFQRDVLLEPLTQSERNVIYAARDFARFRKEFFFGLAATYYNTLLLTYRQIEIESQNYFTQVRALDQGREEERAGLQSRIQVDQFEQSMLQGQSRLISICNRVEGALDDLKIDMGLPTETPINVDLDELFELTLRDEVAVAGEQLRRALRRVDAERSETRLNHDELLNAGDVLGIRFFQWLQLREQLERQPIDITRPRKRHAELSAEAARRGVRRLREGLEKDRRAVPPSPPVRLIQRTMDVVDAILLLVERQLRRAELEQLDPGEMLTIQSRREESARRGATLRQQLDEILRSAEFGQLTTLLTEAERLFADVERLLADANLLLAEPPAEEPDQQALERTIRRIEELVTHIREMLDQSTSGLIPLEMNVDDAMMSALLGRFDLMNERGLLADDRRAIKLTADDLKSVLNLNASQTVRTSRNRPFNFSFNDSTTSLGLRFDLPLNRKAQRNSYRRALINYNAAWRSLMAFEDRIKLSLRDELRSLALARIQYQIAVASAALGAERVVSTRLELSLGLANVAARDFLEAQDAYRQSLGGVADNHIGYLVDRARFFLDLELMELDEYGFWPEIYDENFQPQSRYAFPDCSGPAYGPWHPRLKYSRRMRRLFEQQVEAGQVPPATSTWETAPQEPPNEGE